MAFPMGFPKDWRSPVLPPAVYQVTKEVFFFLEGVGVGCGGVFFLLGLYFFFEIFRVLFVGLLCSCWVFFGCFVLAGIFWIWAVAVHQKIVVL